MGLKAKLKKIISKFQGLKLSSTNPVRVSIPKGISTSLTGFTMLEIVLAVVILSLVIAGVFGTFLTGKRYIVESAHKIEAINFIRAKLEELKATDYDQLWDGSDTVTFTDGLTGNRVWDVVWVTEGRSIRVDVSWSEEGTTLTESAMTMIADIGD